MKKSVLIFLVGIISLLVNMASVSGQELKRGDSIQLDTHIISGKTLHSIDKKYSGLQAQLQRKTEKLLKKMQQKESRLNATLVDKDSLKAAGLFNSAQSKYQQFENDIKKPADLANAVPGKQYVPMLDSMLTAMKFLKMQGGLMPEQLQQISSVTEKLGQLQADFQKAGEIREFIAQREQQLKDALQNSGLDKELLGINKEVYYYQQQLAAYKDVVNDPDKMEQLVLKGLNQLPAFRDFMSQNSFLAALFPMPDGYGTATVLAGLQSRAQLQGIVTGQLGGSDPATYVNQQYQQAQTAINKIKDKLNQLGGNSGSGDMTIPDFKPNTQKTKPFLQRLEYGLNMQNQAATSITPVINEIALTLGYRINDKTSAGVGASYKLGLGKGIQDITFTSEGAGLRSYFNFKAKGSIWISGGYEFNYLQSFQKLAQLENVSAWQRSALVGLMKKFSAAKKSGNIQLLYDLLYMQQVPHSQPLKFRIGYSF